MHKLREMYTFRSWAEKKFQWLTQQAESRVFFSHFQSPYCMQLLKHVHITWTTTASGICGKLENMSVIYHWTTGKVSFNITLMTMHFPSHWIFWKCNLPSHVECLQYNNRLHMTLCFINFSRHSIIVDRAHGTGLIILTQNSSHSEILLLIFNAKQKSSDNG